MKSDCIECKTHELLTAIFPETQNLGKTPTELNDSETRELKQVSRSKTEQRRRLEGGNTWIQEYDGIESDT